MLASANLMVNINCLFDHFSLISLLEFIDMFVFIFPQQHLRLREKPLNHTFIITICVKETLETPILPLENLINSACAESVHFILWMMSAENGYL